MISDKIFEEIYDYPYGFQEYNQEMIMEDDFTVSRSDVAYNCKLWALNKGFLLQSMILSKDGNGICNIIKKSDSNKVVYESMGDSEHDAIFAACDWIRCLD